MGRGVEGTAVIHLRAHTPAHGLSTPSVHTVANRCITTDDANADKKTRPRIYACVRVCVWALSRVSVLGRLSFATQTPTSRTQT